MLLKILVTIINKLSEHIKQYIKLQLSLNNVSQGMFSVYMQN